MYHCQLHLPPIITKSLMVDVTKARSTQLPSHHTAPHLCPCQSPCPCRSLCPCRILGHGHRSDPCHHNGPGSLLLLWVTWKKDNGVSVCMYMCAYMCVCISSRIIHKKPAGLQVTVNLRPTGLTTDHLYHHCLTILLGQLLVPVLCTKLCTMC